MMTIDYQGENNDLVLKKVQVRLVDSSNFEEARQNENIKMGGKRNYGKSGIRQI